MGRHVNCIGNSNWDNILRLPKQINNNNNNNNIPTTPSSEPEGKLVRICCTTVLQIFSHLVVIVFLLIHPSTVIFLLFIFRINKFFSLFWPKKFVDTFEKLKLIQLITTKKRWVIRSEELEFNQLEKCSSC
jgi:hypothetical protein